MREMQTLNRNKQRGFTLIEMAVVLVIVGLLLGGMLVPLSTQMETDRRKETVATLESIREALIGYAVINGSLPCQDTNNDGLPGPGACLTGANQRNVGGLPYATLGVSRTDAWGNTWTYAVNGAYTQALTLPPPAVTNNGQGDLEVRAAAGCAGTQRGELLPALVISNAKTTNGGTLEPENRDADRCFVDAGYSLLTNGFDDLVVWIPTGVLYNRLVAAGTLP
jgi:prepilin-type N-terminal cleavage/methylation domain-containing protein